MLSTVRLVGQLDQMNQLSRNDKWPWLYWGFTSSKRKRLASDIGPFQEDQLTKAFLIRPADLLAYCTEEESMQGMHRV